MSAPSVAPGAVSLPWLRPATASLLALTDEHPAPVVLRDDPALVAHLLRYIRPTPDADTFVLADAAVQAAPLDTAAELLVRFPDLSPIDLNSPAVAAGRALAQAAADIAARDGKCSPDAAWCAGLLTGLGEYALEQSPHPVAARPPSPSETVLCENGGGGLQTHNPASPSVLGSPLPPFSQRTVSEGEGLGVRAFRTPVTAVQLARRLAGRWRLPNWLTVAIGFPELSPAQAAKLGGHAGLTAVLAEARSQTPASCGTNSQAGESNTPVAENILLPRLLRATAAARRRSAEALVSDLEARIDGLTAALAEAGSHFDHALRAAKLESLAEFAAGASHEINNPLAVIAGNVQRVLNAQENPALREALTVSLKQTKRIQELLQGTRQFARPPQPNRESVSLAAVAADAVRDLTTEADSHRVSVTVDPTGVTAFADAKHTRTVLVHLLRNAIDAAGEGGWVRIGFASEGEAVQVFVDDSGPGPATAAIPHLFDPFFSGRVAGRGRGLGLSIAWRLATHNGGDVTFTPRAGLPTRFVLTLPTANELRLWKTA